MLSGFNSRKAEPLGCRGGGSTRWRRHSQSRRHPYGRMRTAMTSLRRAFPDQRRCRDWPRYGPGSDRSRYGPRFHSARPPSVERGGSQKPQKISLWLVKRRTVDGY